MPDFLLDTRPLDQRPPIGVAQNLTWTGRIRSRTWDRPEFRLTVTWAEPDALWRPWSRPEGSLVAVVGFLALDEQEWAAAEREQPPEAEGGLAASAAWHRYTASGTEAWDAWSGNCAILLYDASAGRLYLRTDRATLFA